MKDLFDDTDNGALFSQCRKYRYALWRIWNKDKGLVMFICLNPSKADELIDDPTIRRVRNFASDWGYGGVYMMNLFAWINPNPSKLKKCPDPLGENNRYLNKFTRKCDMVIFAWGAYNEAKERAKEVTQMFDGYALAINKDGSPKHPLYVKKDVRLIRYSSEGKAQAVRRVIDQEK